MLSDKRLILVIDGDSFPAMHAIAHLLKENYAVRATLEDIEDAEYLRELLGIHRIPGQLLDIHQATLGQKNGWLSAFENVDYVFNFSTKTHQGLRDFKKVHDCLTNQSKFLIEYAQRANVKRIIKASSLATVYYDQSSDHDLAISENAWSNPLMPTLSHVQQSQIFDERLFLQLQSTTDIELVSLITGSIWGPILSEDHLRVQRDLFGPSALSPFLKKQSTYWPIDVRDFVQVALEATRVDLGRDQRFIVANNSVTSKQLAQIKKRAIAKSARFVSSALRQQVFKLYSQNENDGFIVQSNRPAKLLDTRRYKTKFKTSFRSIDTTVKDFFDSIPSIKQLKRV